MTVKQFTTLVTVVSLPFCVYAITRLVAQDNTAMNNQTPNSSTEKQSDEEPAPLTSEERRVIVDGGTERAFSGKYWEHFEVGAYACRQCGALLYHADHKFESECGWPSFDNAFNNSVRRLQDADGIRTEIRCTACDGHLGHVFLGERLTQNNTRHCVNSISMTFIPEDELNLETAFFAGGCFWGVEHQLKELGGVLATTSGYMGGWKDNPTYREVCTGRTGHAEAVAVLFDPSKISFEDLTRRFFETHDPTTLNQQGPDVGTQYRSAVYYMSEEQKEATESLIKELEENGYDVVTELEEVVKFWPGELYHQDYLDRNPNRPSCHVPVDRFSRGEDFE
jgi:peptide methionine sulfoxide reductase msrA/msrB